MADDGRTANPPNVYNPSNRKNTTTGIIQLPAGSRGPKSLYLKRHGSSFGFTLRHFIVYPPDSVADNYDERHAAVGALSTPMDTIFVKHVKDGGPAQQAGLQCGDRIVGVNRVAVTDKSYSQIVQLIQNSPEYLHLLVVPKEEDILQRYYSETAYNPASNQNPSSSSLDSSLDSHRFPSKPYGNRPGEFHVDAVSWRSLQNSYGGHDYDGRYVDKQMASSNQDQIYSSGDVEFRRKNSSSNNGHQIYSVNQSDAELVRRPRLRAQPQVPLYKKTGRRASDGCALAEREMYYDPNASSDPDEIASSTGKLPVYAAKNSTPTYRNATTTTAGGGQNSRLSFDEARRESTSSIASSLADGSLNSFDSSSTLTGHDDSAIMSRYRKSFQKKEEFLKMPDSTTTPISHLIQREFYGRPKKLERSMWPPNEPLSPLKSTDHYHQVTDEWESTTSLNSRLSSLAEEQAKCDQATTAAQSVGEQSSRIISADETAALQDDKRTYPASSQIVHRRAKEFESGKPLPEDDPLLSNRMSFYKSEIARLSEKRVVPNVPERAQEYEVRSLESKGDQSFSVVMRKNQKKSIPAKNYGSANSGSDNEVIDGKKKLSGNVMIFSGNKHVHCPLPSDSAESEKAMRRISYLRATEGGRMQFDSDLSDDDIGKIMGSGSCSSGGSSSSLEKDKAGKLRSEPIAEVEVKTSNQLAVPQPVPVSTAPEDASPGTVQQNKSKSSTSRSRSPTGQSPVCKTRKSSQTSADPAVANLKTKTWRGRVAKQFRKIQGSSSPNPRPVPDGSTFGIALDHCIPSTDNPYVPRFVQVCTDIIDARGLQTVGIYRVPGNNASITALADEINRNYETVPVEDHRLNDVHVVSSLLKSYFRKMPDSLVTNALYPSFIKADKIDGAGQRMKELKKLIMDLPPHNYHTLKHIVLHLKRIVENSNFNKMEAKNLAIVFGPTIIRAEEDNMEHLVNNMTHQCKIVESLLTHADWFFSEDDMDSIPIDLVSRNAQEPFEPPNNQMLLLDNISKYEALKDREKNGAIFSSIISAAHRKVTRKNAKSSSKDLSPTSTNNEDFSQFSPASTNSFNASPKDNPRLISTTVTDMERLKEQQRKQKMDWFNYSTDQEHFHKRIEKFEQETKAMLEMPRTLEICINNNVAKGGNLSSSVMNVSEAQCSLLRPTNPQLLKTHSASNVLAKNLNLISSDRNSLSVMDSSYENQCASNLESNRDVTDVYSNFRYNNIQCSKVASSSGGAAAAEKVQATSTMQNSREKRNGMVGIRKCNSVENVDQIGDGNQTKRENKDGIIPAAGSLDSLNKMAPADDGIDLVTSLTKLYDKKLMEGKHTPTKVFSDKPSSKEESPKTPPDASHNNKSKESFLDAKDLYRNPLLHKDKQKLESDNLKSEDGSPFVESQEKRKSLTNKLISGSASKFLIFSDSKLKRSESLNRPERTVLPYNSNKLKRSESFNKTTDKLKRLESLTKNEKTESNLNKKKELAVSLRKARDGGKLKRKNGEPDRSIKRRHTVGGTKDPDKVTWFDASSNKENKGGKLRTSSPDLSSTKRERPFFEINFIATEDALKSVRQKLVVASRPQSLPESAVFKVPLESHV